MMMKAVSGGGRGRTIGRPDTSMSSFSPYRKASSTQRGGSIPPGRWKIENPDKYDGAKMPPVSRLTPLDGQFVAYGNRDAFLIHGRGADGSDGCIVIELTPRTLLLDAVRAQGSAILSK